MMITKEDIDTYKNKGYVKIQNLLTREDKETIALIANVVVEKFQNISKINVDNKNEIVNKILQTKEFTQYMSEMRGKKPEEFSILYDSLQMSTLLHSLASGKSILDISAQLLGTNKGFLASYNHMLRMDFPNDTRNSYGWHQDSPYNFSNISGNNCVVVWFPLHDLDSSNGALMVKTGSHVHGMFDVTDTQVPGGSRQLNTNKNIVEGYATESANLNYGDVLFMNNDLIHASGINSSKSIRYTVISRVHKMISDDFIPGRVCFNYNKHAIKSASETLTDSKEKKSLKIINTLVNLKNKGK